MRRSSSAPAVSDPLTPGSYNASPEVYRFGSGATVVVRSGPVLGADGGLYTEPLTASDSTGLCVLVPGSYISNADELAERLDEQPASDRRSEGAALILRLYARDPDPLLVLSELQGSFAFFLFDAERRTAFAARDGSGEVPLFFEIDDDGGVSVASAPVTVPSAHVGLTQWEALPAGRYIAGRAPRVHRFALTQEEMAEREAMEACLEDECISPRAAHSPTRGLFSAGREAVATASSWH